MGFSQLTQQDNRWIITIACNQKNCHFDQFYLEKDKSHFELFILETDHQILQFYFSTRC